MATITTFFSTPNAAFFERVRWHLSGQHDVTLLPKAINEPQLLMFIGAQRPSVVLLDAGSFGERAITVLAKILAASPATKTLLLSPDCTEQFIVYALQNGGSGCLCSACGPGDLLRAIRTVHTGELWATRKTIAYAFRRMLVLGRAGEYGKIPHNQLSRREHEIAEWMDRGMSNKEIARKLGISDFTVKTHAQNIFRKLEISGRRRLRGAMILADPSRISRALSASTLIHGGVRSPA